MPHLSNNFYRNAPHGRPGDIRFCHPLLPSLMVALLISLISGCTGLQPVPTEGDGQSYLQLDVEPTTAEIYVDDEYQGIVEGWHRQVLPVKPGRRRVELRAGGYITQRFDVDVEEDQWLVLTLRLERSIDGRPSDGTSPEEENDPLRPPSHPMNPEPDDR